MLNGAVVEGKKIFFEEDQGFHLVIVKEGSHVVLFR